jgi:hypothetical protein
MKKKIYLFLLLLIMFAPTNAYAFKSYLKSEIRSIIDYIVEGFQSLDGFSQYFIMGTTKNIGKKIFEDDEKSDQNQTK